MPNLVYKLGNETFWVDTDRMNGDAVYFKEVMDKVEALMPRHKGESKKTYTKRVIKFFMSNLVDN